MEHKLDFQPDKHTSMVIDHQNDRIFILKNQSIIDVIEIGFNYQDNLLEISANNVTKINQLKRLIDAENNQERDKAFAEV